MHCKFLEWTTTFWINDFQISLHEKWKSYWTKQRARPYLNDSHQSANSNSRKKKVWDEIAKSVSALSIVNRSPTECRTTLQCLRSSVKNKAAERTRTSRKTGRGSPPPLTSLDNTVLDLVPSTRYDGIEGGVDISLPVREEAVEYCSTDGIKQACRPTKPDSNVGNFLPSAPPASIAASPSGTSTRSETVTEVDESLNEAMKLQRRPLRQHLVMLPTISADVKDLKERFALIPVCKTL